MNIDPGSERLPGFAVSKSRAVKFAIIAFFPFVEYIERLRRLAQLVQFACYQVIRIARRPHSGVPAYTVQPAWHMRTAEQSRFAPEPSCVAILEATFQSAVDEQIRVT